jgi:HSP20 family molecular chaperone IbpA
LPTSCCKAKAVPNTRSASSPVSGTINRSRRSSAIASSYSDSVLRIDARIDTGKYQGLQPLYTEYNVGHFARSFSLSNKIDQQEISAELEDGVLTLTLKKTREAAPRRIEIG